MIGFIGAGNMSQAIIGGILKSELYNSNEIYCSAKSEKSKEKIQIKFNVNVCSNIEVVQNSRIIFLGVKPKVYETVLEEIKDYIGDKIIISIAPLKTIDFLRTHTNPNLKCVSSMPNTPAMVCSGMSAVSFSENLADKEKGAILSLFNSFGKVEVVDESLMQSVVAVSGSAPAYVYMFIEALADGAVKNGMSRELAYKFAAQTVLGSAKMVLETGEHPAKLKDDVCSPGGTTIEAVCTLNKGGFQGLVIEAMDSVIKKMN